MFTALSRFSRTRPWVIIAACLVLSSLSAAYTAQHLSFDADATKLLSEDLPWRQREAKFDKAFPQNIDLLAIVIDGKNPELTESATAKLAAALSQHTERFRTVRRPDGGPFFDRQGLLYLSADEVQATTEQIIAAQPLIGPLAADTNLRGLFGALTTFLTGIAQGAAPITAMEAPMTAIASSLNAAVDGHIQAPSWRLMFTGQKPRPQELRRFILVQPVLDFTSLTPGAAATELVRSLAHDLSLDKGHGISVRLTGPVALADDEFGTLAEGMGLSGVLSVLAVGILLFIGLGSFRLIGAILATLVTGLILTAGFAALAVGSLNLISVAFAVLFWGIAVDFGIQVSVAYRQARHDLGDNGQALDRALNQIGAALCLAALTTSVGFLSFLPTDYRGVSELGLIAGIGMLIALALNLTLLPALLSLLHPRGEAESVGYRALAPLDTFILGKRRMIMIAALMLGVGAAALCSQLEFDFNPLNIKDKHTESVATLLDLMTEATTTPNTIDVLTQSVEAADALAQKIGALPEAAHAVSIKSYIPEDQDTKLAMIEDARMLMTQTFAKRAATAKPDDAAIIASLTSAKSALEPLLTNKSAAALSSALDRLIQAPPKARVLAHDALIPGLEATLGQLETALQASPVGFDDLPKELKEAWISADGRSRVEIFPSGDANDNDVLRRFVSAVRAIAPDATGTPVSIQESSRTIVNAFVTAGLLALAAISLLLVLILRSVHDTALVVLPLILAGLLTLASCVLVGLPINFANIIALPLLFGVGVAFNIYFVMAWRRGEDHFLQSSLTRAIIFSAASTASAFGSLAASSHPGTSEMGILLTMSLAFTLATALILLPALLGPAAKPVAKAV
jgi:hopanoid biosynthesis associated RND transporter like protein HpnN